MLALRDALGYSRPPASGVPSPGKASAQTWVKSAPRESARSDRRRYSRSRWARFARGRLQGLEDGVSGQSLGSVGQTLRRDGASSDDAQPCARHTTGGRRRPSRRQGQSGGAGRPTKTRHRYPATQPRARYSGQGTFLPGSKARTRAAQSSCLPCSGIYRSESCRTRSSHL
jgi:hypothetical protein